MTLSDKTIGQLSNLTVNCNTKDDPHSTAMHRLLQQRMKHKSRCIIRHNTNLILFLAPFVAGIRPSEMTDVAYILNLPNAKISDQTIRCHQPEISQAIINLSTRPPLRYLQIIISLSR